MATVLMAGTANAMLSAFALKALYASTHSADPSTTGANEITAAGRKAITWGSPSASSMSGTFASAFSEAASAVVNFIGYWDASSAGNFVASFSIATETFGVAGTLTVTGCTESLA